MVLLVVGMVVCGGGQCLECAASLVEGVWASRFPSSS